MLSMKLKRRLEIGIGTCFDYDCSFEPMCRMIAKAGFKAVTVGAKVSHSGYDSEAGRKSINKLLFDLSLRADSIHAPYGDEADIAFPDERLETPVKQEPPGAAAEEELRAGELSAQGQSPRRRQPAERRLQAIAGVKATIDAAMALRSQIVIVHPTARLQADETRARISAARDSLHELIPYAATRNIRLALENLPSPLSMQVFETLLEQLPELGVCYDSSHALLSGDVFGVIKRHKERVIAIHIADNQGKDDVHTLPFEGILAWDEFAHYFRKLPHIRTFMLEVETRESAFKDRGEFLAEALRRAKQVLAYCAS